MSTRSLHRKIDDLPPDAAAEVEDFVESLLARRGGTSTRSARDGQDSEALLRRIGERRERLLRERGAFDDSTAMVRELRQSGT